MKRFNPRIAIAGGKETEIGRENRPVLRAERLGDIELKPIGSIYRLGELGVCCLHDGMQDGDAN